MERPATEGDRPVGDSEWSPERYLSKSGHVKPGLNLRGPSRKAKYSLTTDSEPVERSKDEKNPVEGRNVNLKPYAYKRSEHYGLWQSVTACLLHNDPASYRQRPG